MAVATRPLATPSSAAMKEESATGIDRAIRILAYLVLIIAALLMFAPFVFSVVTSLKSEQEANRLTWSNMFWPDTVTLDAYRTVFDTNIERWFLNSVFVAAIWVIGRAIADSMAGYAFARMEFPGRRVVFLMVLSTLMIPGMVTIIPKFIILDNLGLLNTYGALTIPFLSSAFGIFLMKQFFETIPKELEEAARVDGASRYRMFAQIVLPNAMPALIALSIFSFQGSWNAFLEPVVFISGSNPDLFTLPLGTGYFRYEYDVNWPVLMAISVVTVVPIAIFYLIFQRWFVEGVTTSGIKG
jgi:multiple sugar transport system permease protein